MNRGYLLPKGCKDLIDMLKPKLRPLVMPYSPAQLLKSKPILPSLNHPPTPLPPIVGEMVIPDQTTVRQLAVLLNQKPFQIIGDLMQFGFFVTNTNKALGFEVISSIARKYGFIAKRAV